MKVERRLAVVLDTNVWISAALSQAGPPAKVVAHVLAYALPVFCDATFAELHSRIWKPKFDRYLTIEARNKLLDTALAVARWVEIQASLSTQTHCRDPDDDVFIHTALSANAQWLVTGDDDLLSAPAVPHLQIVSPKQALAQPVFQTPG
ncbi:putative toxin-antitoxin system toxin component, PIN family [Xylophilus sp. GW821-FHT01B05]